MKIISVDAETRCNNSPSVALDNEKAAGRVHVLADTTLLTHKKPVFVPDFGKSCTARCCVAVRISRLGKSIEQRFAARYFDGFTIALKFEVEGFGEDDEGGRFRPDVSVNFDGAVSAGEWIDADKIKTDELDILMSAGENSFSRATSGIRNRISHSISLASEYFTIRQGDVMLLPFEESAFTAKPNTHVSGRINNKDIIEFNIK